MPNPILHHVTVEVHKSVAAECLNFYRGVLGLKHVISPIKQTAWFEQGIHLYWGGEPERIRYGEQPKAHHFAVVVGDQYEIVRGACQRINLFLEDATEYWGKKRCYIRDPMGNRIELMEGPPP